MISRSDFHRVFVGSFWNKLSDSLVPIPTNHKPNKKEFLDQLYNDIRTKKYYPDLPRSYIIYDKHNRVSRMVPVFHHRENCVYFYCLKELEQHVAINRVEGTFGGWTLGN